MVPELLDKRDATCPLKVLRVDAGLPNRGAARLHIRQGMSVRFPHRR